MSREELLRGNYEYVTEDFEDYPYIILTGVVTKEELEMLKERSDLYSKTSYDSEGEETEIKVDSCDLYVEFNDKVKKIGTFFFSLQYVLSLKYVGNYSLRLCLKEGEDRVIDLKDGNDLIKFIQL